MFQGIISSFANVAEVTNKPGMMHLTLSVDAAFLSGCELGGSISIDGCCLSVTAIAETKVSFDLMQETLTKTVLRSLKLNDVVNAERSLKAGDEIGGHLLSGHVDGVAKIIKIENPENNHIITFQVSNELSRYIFSKGYIALNGVSLTVVNASYAERTFQVYLIPETLKRTTFGLKKVGDNINVEIDRQTQAIVETIERIAERKQLIGETESIDAIGLFSQNKIDAPKS